MPWAVGLAAFAAYLHGLAPSIGSHDAAALAASLRGWGVPHPPGFPLWSLSARLIGTVLPFGDWAYRANLASAVMAAGAVALLADAARRLTGSGSAAAAAALLTGTAPVWWRRAVGAEVFAGAALFAAASIWLIARGQWPRDGALPPGRGLSLAGLLSGVGLAHQPVLLLMVPGLAVMAAGCVPGFVGRRGEPSGSPWAGLNGSLATRAGPYVAMYVAIGLALYLTLPLRALTDPRMNWGAPATAAAWRDHVLRREFGTASFSPAAAEPFTPRLTARLAGAYAASLSDAYTPLGVAIGLVGAAAWCRGRRGTPRRRERWLAGGAVAAALGSGLGFLLLARVAPDPDRWVVIEKHLMASLVPAGLLVAFGLASLARWKSGLGAPLFAFALFLAGVRAVEPGSRNLLTFHDFAENTLRSLPAHAVTITTGDTAAFTLWARQAAGRRRDVAVVWTVMPPWRARQTARRVPDLAPAALGQDGWLNRVVDRSARSGRPVYEVGDAPWPAEARPVRTIAGYAMRIGGQSLTFKFLRQAEMVMDALTVRRPPRTTRRTEESAIRETISVESAYWGRLGMAAAARKDWVLAQRAMVRATWLDPSSATARHNLRVLGARNLNVKL